MLAGWLIKSKKIMFSNANLLFNMLRVKHFNFFPLN